MSKSYKSPKKSRRTLVGKIILVVIPGNKRPRWRWITGISSTGLLRARAPKIGVLIRDLKKKKDKDYGPEKTLPKGSKEWSH